MRVPSNIKVPPLTLVGVGVRKVSFLGVKVYSIAFYADLNNPKLVVSCQVFRILTACVNTSRSRETCPQKIRLCILFVTLRVSSELVSPCKCFLYFLTEYAYSANAFHLLYSPARCVCARSSGAVGCSDKRRGDCRANCSSGIFAYEVPQKLVPKCSSGKTQSPRHFSRCPDTQSPTAVGF